MRRSVGHWEKPLRSWNLATASLQDFSKITSCAMLCSGASCNRGLPAIVVPQSKLCIRATFTWLPPNGAIIGRAELILLQYHGKITARSYTPPEDGRLYILKL